jgi:hypothetical protein
MSTTLLTPAPLPYPTPTVHFRATAWWTCRSSGQYTWRNRSDCLLATGHPLSVVPPTIRNLLDLDTTPVPGWKGTTPTWYGNACRIGRATL